MKKNRSVIIIFIFMILYTCLVLWGVGKEKIDDSGLPFMTLYELKEYNGHPQTRAILQDKRGIMYFANGYGVLEFDGVTWRLMETPNKTMCHSLAVDENTGRIYVGASSDLGYLAPDVNGKMAFFSLLDKINNEDKVFSYVWTTHVTSEGIYFQSTDWIFLFYQDNLKQYKVKVWRAKEIWPAEEKTKGKRRFNYAFWIDNTYFVHVGNEGLMKIENGELKLIPGGEEFRNDRVQVMLSYSEENREGSKIKMIVGTFNRGLFLFDGKSFKKFNCEANSFLQKNTLYSCTVLKNGMFGFCTRNGGLLIMNKDGKIFKILNQEAGLPSNSIAAAFVDREGNTWFSPDGGVALLAPFPASFTYYRLDNANTSYITAITRHKGILYAGGQGVSYLDVKESKFKYIGFENISDSKGSRALDEISQCFQLLAVDDELLVAAGDQGVYQLRDKKLEVIHNASGTQFAVVSLHYSKKKDVVFVGLFNGLSILRRFHSNPRKWCYEGDATGRIEGINEYIYNIQEPENESGVLWLGTFDKGLIQLDFNSNKPLIQPDIKRFKEKDGLEDGQVLAFKKDNGVIFSTTNGFFYPEIDKSAENKYTFRLAEELKGFNNKNEYPFAEAISGDIWLLSNNKLHYLRKQMDGNLKDDSMTVRRISGESISYIYPEENGIVWLGSLKHIFRYDPEAEDPIVKKEESPNFSTLIRLVKINNTKDIFFDNEVLTSSIQKDEATTDKTTTLKYEENSIRFEFAASSFIDSKENRFQWRLEGEKKEDKWSPWSKETKKDFSKLPVGTYSYSVRSQNLYGKIGEEVKYEFCIQPPLNPWYLTIWAKMFYFFVFLVLVRLLIQQYQERRKRTSQLNQLSNIGQDITAVLNIEKLIDTVYKEVNTLMDASTLGVGIFHKENNTIEFPGTKENEKFLPHFFYSLEDDNRPAVWCFKNQKMIFSNDFKKEYKKYINELKEAVAGEITDSVIYLPLTYKEKRIGVITAQSFQKNAYSEYHLNILRNLATYIAIAFNNAEAYKNLNTAMENLKATQEQLIAQEKLATLGTLTAGVAHEVNNPLNFIINYSEVAAKLVEELSREIKNSPDKKESPETGNVEEILKLLEEDTGKIKAHGKRIAVIVENMLLQTRGGSQEHRATDVNALLEETLNLAYHSMRAYDRSFNVTIEKNLDPTVGTMDLVSQDISRAFLNLINNGFYAVHKKKQEIKEKFSPTLIVSTKNLGNRVEISIRDNGSGIPEDIRNRLFTPFFTTKPTGQGTGLGLYISHGIVESLHKGKIQFDTQIGEYTEFKIILPRNKK